MSRENIGVEYLYAFVSDNIGKACVVLRVEDNAGVEKLLSENGFTLM